jgi:hypothetical protein
MVEMVIRRRGLDAVGIAHLLGLADTALARISGQTGCCPAALSALRQASDGIVVHFDVDAVDSADLPLANYPHYGTGHA